MPSTRNQRIESWWSQLSKQRSSWWRAFFQDLEVQNIYDATLEVHREALWYCFHSLLQNELDFIKEHWNSHFIRKSRYDTIGGRPDVMYNIPEEFGGEGNLKLSITNENIEYVREHVIEETEEENEYTDYFDYVRNECGLEIPQSYEEGIGLFRALTFYGENGN